MTIRQLGWMVDRRRRIDWEPMTHLLALTANVHRDEKKRRQPFVPHDFLPFAERTPEKLIQAPISALRILLPPEGRETRQRVRLPRK